MSAADPMEETKFWFRSIVIAILLAILALAVLKLAGVPDGLTAIVLTLITGFAGNFALSMQESQKRERDREDLKRALEESDRRRADEASAVAGAAKEAVDVLKTSAAVAERKLDGIAAVGNASHAFLNSERGVLLQKYAIALRRTAKDSGNAGDIEAADRADLDYAAHQAAQAEVDAQPGTDAQKKGEPP